LRNFKFPLSKDITQTKIDSILCPNHQPFVGENLFLTKESQDVLNLWSKFITSFPKESPLRGFPIWSHEWGATYPYENDTPLSTNIDDLKKHKGTYGKKIVGKNKEDMISEFIPRYAQKDQTRFPDWKIRFIKRNREFYQDNKEFIDDFLLSNPQLKKFEFSYQKLEWSCQGAERTFEDKIIQFRPSGLRVKLNNWAPALTTIRTQNVYIPKLKRKLSLLERLKLQSMELDHLPDVHDGEFIPNGGFKALGNAVNVEVVRLIAKNLLNNE